MHKNHSVETVQAVCLPILLAISPILFLFQLNQPDLPVSVLWQPLAISAATGAALFIISRIMIKQSLKAGVLASLLVVGLFYFGVFRDVLNQWIPNEAIFLGLWMALIILGIAALYRTDNVGKLSRFLLVVSAVMAAFSVVKIALYTIQNPTLSASDPQLWPTSLQEPSVTMNNPLPDIYYIVPDDYARTDILREQLGFDNSQFIAELEKRGFVIAEQSRSPYSDSESNMASALNLDYLSRFGTVLGETSDNAVMVMKVLADNRASRFMESLGYRYIHIDSDNTTYPGDNPFISPIAAPDNLTYLWLRATILRAFGGRFGFRQESTDERFSQSVLAAFDRLNATPNMPGPKFVFFHTLIPHDPYVFGPHGERVTFPNPSDERLGSTDGVAFYVSQLQFSSKLLLQSIDQILAASKTPPIIIIESDEGFQANPDTFGEEQMQDIRVKGLTAFYLPGADASSLPQDLNTVNTFRYLFDLYFGMHMGMLKSASYAEGDYPYQPVEIEVTGDPTPQTP